MNWSQPHYAWFDVRKLLFILCNLCVVDLNVIIIISALEFKEYLWGVNQAIDVLVEIQEPELYSVPALQLGFIFIVVVACEELRFGQLWRWWRARFAQLRLSVPGFDEVLYSTLNSSIVNRIFWKVLKNIQNVLLILKVIWIDLIAIQNQFVQIVCLILYVRVW